MKYFIVLFCMLFTISTYGSTPSLLDDQDRSLPKRLLAEKLLGQTVVLTPEQNVRMLKTVKTAVAAEYWDTLPELGSKAQDAIRDINEKGLTEDLALRALVLQKTFETNQVRYDQDPPSTENTEATKKLQSLQELVKNKMKL